MARTRRFRAKPKKTSEYQFSPFDIGQIKAHVHHGLGATAIAHVLLKPDSRWKEGAVRKVMAKLQTYPSWREERKEGSSRPRETTPKQDKQIVKHVLDTRGKQKVTVRTLKRDLPFLRDFSDTLVEERLAHAEDGALAYLPRREKSIVASEYLPGRVSYCNAVKRMRQSTLERWAYVDGATWYLDRTEAEFEGSKRAALGKYVWRRLDGRDAMFEDCLGPSKYQKAQGRAVTVWGFLACGVFHIRILEDGEAMNEELYVDFVEDCFADWSGNCEFLVQDFERCLRTKASLRAIAQAGLQLVPSYPVSSQDFNAVENCWHSLREWLYQTMPSRIIEDRDTFILRFRHAVAWLNRHRKDQLWYLSTNQKERAADCLSSEPPGGRTKW